MFDLSFLDVVFNSFKSVFENQDVLLSGFVSGSVPDFLFFDFLVFVFVVCCFVVFFIFLFIFFDKVSKSKRVCVRGDLLDSSSFYNEGVSDSGLGFFCVFKFVLIFCFGLLVVFGFVYFFNLSFFLDSSDDLVGYYVLLSEEDFDKGVYENFLSDYYEKVSSGCVGEAVVVGRVFGEVVDFSDFKFSSNVGDLEVVFVDDFGNFELFLGCVGEVVLSFELDGFVPFYKKVFLVDGLNELNVFLFKENDFVFFENDEDFFVEGDGFKLNFLRGSLVDGNGVFVEGAKVSLTVFDSTNKKDFVYFPGNQLGVGLDGKVVGLESFGFFKIKVRDLDGFDLFLKEGGHFVFSFEIFENQLGFAPKEIPVWNFDEGLGVWVFVGVARKNCGVVCYYDFNFPLIGSWMNFAIPFTESSEFFLGNFDLAVSNVNRNLFVFGESGVLEKGGDDRVFIRSGEVVVNFDKPKTNLICETDRIEGYYKEELVSYRESVNMEFVLDTTSIVDYFGRGVIQGIKSPDGVIRDVETDCVCRQIKKTYNKMLYSCYGIDKTGKRYDNCITSSVDFWCNPVEIEKDCSDPCVDFETFKKCNPDFEEYYGFVKKFEEDFKKNNGYGSTALDFWRAYLRMGEPYHFVWEQPQPKISEGVNYAHWLVMRPFFNMSGFDSSTIRYPNPRPGTKQFDVKMVRMGNKIVNFDRLAVGINTRQFIPTSGIQNSVSLLHGVVDPFFNTFFQLYSLKHKNTAFNSWFDVFYTRVNLQNYYGDLFGDYFAFTRSNWKNKTPTGFFKENFFEFVCEKNSFSKGLLNFNSPLKSLYSGGSRWNTFLERLESRYNRAYNRIKSNNYLTGNFILNVSEDFREVSVFEGLDVVSGKIHYPINDFVYYSDLPFFGEKLLGDLIVFDSFVVEKEGVYFFGNKEGVFELVVDDFFVSESLVSFENDFGLLEFGERVGEVFFITKEKYFFDGSVREVNYFYDEGRLSKVLFEDEEVVFVYDGDKLVSISFVFGQDVLRDFFVYDGSVLSSVVSDYGEGSFFIVDFFRTKDSFVVDSNFLNKEFVLDKGLVNRLVVSDKFLEDFEEYDFVYDGDYAFIFSEGGVVSCFKGVCFIEELVNLVTTSVKCFDGNDRFFVPLEDDLVVLRVFGVNVSNGFFEREVVFEDGLFLDFNLFLPSKANVEVFLEVNGVPSDSVSFFVDHGEKLVFSDLLGGSRFCDDVGVSFGGFGLDNCLLFEHDFDRLKKCFVGSLGLFDLSLLDVVVFIEESSLDVVFKRNLVSFFEELE